jgi:predicted N-acyltransferase
VLAQAVADFLPREAFSVEQQIQELRHHGPFRRRGDGEAVRTRARG